MAAVLEPGQEVPAVSVLDADEQPVDLRALCAGGPLLISFYPFDWYDPARDHLRALRNRIEEIEAFGVRVVAISRDSPYSHARYAQQQWLTYPLYSDWPGDAVRAFGVGETFEGMVDVPVRACFLVDGAAVVRAAWQFAGEEPTDVDAVLAACAQLGGERSD